MEADRAAKVRSAAPKRSPHRYARPSDSSSATKSNSRQTAASSSTSIPGRMPSSRFAHRTITGHPKRSARSSQAGTPSLLKRSISLRCVSMCVYMSRRPVGPSTSSRRRQRASTSARSSGSAGNSRCSGGDALVHPGEDGLRFAEHALGRDQHRNGRAPARAARREAMDALHVALLAVRDSRPLQRPPRLLAVVADRDRDEPQHGPASYRFGLPVTQFEGQIDIRGQVPG